MHAIEATLRELVDAEAIRTLARRYAHYVWQKDVSGAIGLFTEDGEMDTGERPVIRGKEALTAAYRQMLDQGDWQPFLHNHVIELHGDSATGTCYLDLRATVDGKSMMGAGYYNDQYVRVGNEWKFRSRQLTMSFFAPLDEGWARKPGDT